MLQVQCSAFIVFYSQTGWNQGSRMTSWFDVSAHDLHGAHQNALGGQQKQDDLDFLWGGNDWCRRSAPSVQCPIEVAMLNRYLALLLTTTYTYCLAMGTGA